MRYCEGSSRRLRLPSGRALSLSKWQAPQSHGLGDEGRYLRFASHDGRRECARNDGARIIARGAAAGLSVLIADRWELEPCAKALDSDPMDADEVAHHSEFRVAGDDGCGPFNRAHARGLTSYSI